MSLAPYYDVDGVTLYNGDCRAVLDVVDVVSDLVLTDPPYGIGYSAWHTALRTPELATGSVVGDDVPFDPRWLLDFGRCVIFGANHFAHLLPPGGWVVWSKVQDNRWAGHKRSLAEVAWTNVHNHVSVFNYFWAGSPLYRRGDERGSQLHPTQKPVALMRWLIELWTEAGDLILDPFMGSGPVARAALDCGRRYVGVEIEERYCEVAAKRLGQGVLDFESGS